MSAFDLMNHGVVSRHPWLVVGLVILALVAIPIYRVTFHPLAKFPGPLSWSMTRIPWHISIHSGRLHTDIYKLHQKYGDVVRIAPNELSYTHKDSFRDIYTTRPGHKLLPKNDVWLRTPAVDPEKPQSIMSPEEASHARLRRGFSSAFTEANVAEMGKVVFKHVELMVQQLQRLADGFDATQKEDTAIVDLVDWFDFTTFDISGELSFGEGFGSIEAGKAHPWVEINRNFGKGITLITSVNFMSPLGKIMGFVIPKSVRKKFQSHMEFTVARVNKRLEEGKGRIDFVGAVERYNEECEKKGFQNKMVTQKELQLNMSIIVFAGSETTSTALSSIFRYLVQNRPAMDKLVKEIRGSFETEGDITVTSIVGLEYLDAVIQEGMRLGPPVTVSIPRQVPPGGEEVCGQWIPEGTFVSSSQFAAFRSADHFQDPKKFLPERFVPGQNTYKDNLDIFLPFALGRHQCIGSRLAWLMLRMVIVRLVYAFDIEAVKEMDDFGEQRSFVVWEKKPLMVKLRKHGESTLVES